MHDHLISAQMEEWYACTPLGTMHDACITDADRRHVQLMSQDDLTADEELELNALTDAFVTDLHHAVQLAMQ